MEVKLSTIIVIFSLECGIIPEFLKGEDDLGNANSEEICIISW